MSSMYSRHVVLVVCNFWRTGSMTRLNRIADRGQPCFTPFATGTGSHNRPPSILVGKVRHPLYKDLIKLTSFWGQPDWASASKVARCLMLLKASLRSKKMAIKAERNGELTRSELSRTPFRLEIAFWVQLIPSRLRFNHEEMRSASIDVKCL